MQDRLQHDKGAIRIGRGLRGTGDLSGESTHEAAFGERT
jgi:hypothetical protein